LSVQTARAGSSGRSYHSCCGSLKECSTQPATRSLEVQTQLRWPEGQKVSSILPPSASSTCQHIQTITESFQATILANGSLVKAHRILHAATKTISVHLTANHLIQRPKLNRPPKSDSEIPTSNKYKSLDTEADDGSTSESDFPNPFT